MPVRADWLQAEGILSLRNHRQRDGRCSILFRVHMPGFQPRTEARIEYLRFILPEIGFEAALNLEVIQLQLDAGDIFRKIAPDIIYAYMKPGDSAPFALCFDHHVYLP
jgi:hypothetical protein